MVLAKAHKENLSIHPLLTKRINWNCPWNPKTPLRSSPLTTRTKEFSTQSNSFQLANFSAEDKNWRIQVKRQIDNQIDFSLDVFNNSIANFAHHHGDLIHFTQKWTAYKIISPLLKRKTVLSLRAVKLVLFGFLSVQVSDFQKLFPHSYAMGQQQQENAYQLFFPQKLL